jgi:hypothetical protein
MGSQRRRLAAKPTSREAGRLGSTTESEYVRYGTSDRQLAAFDTQSGRVVTAEDSTSSSAATLQSYSREKTDGM